MANLNDLKNITDRYALRDNIMPTLFIGHGSPMNGIEDNIHSQYWGRLGSQLPLPEAVLVVSAHWLTRGTAVTAMSSPKTIHDFGGFPPALYDIQYHAPGDTELARLITTESSTIDIVPDHEWGLDHGAWTILRHMYPAASIPVLQLSIDYSKPAQYHYDLAKDLKRLRKRGVLIIGSGNIIHNLRLIDWQNMDKPNHGFDWAHEFNEAFMQNLYSHNHRDLINFSSLGATANLAIPTPDHYLPLIYTLGLSNHNEEPVVFNDQFVAGSLSMTSLQFGF